MSSSTAIRGGCVLVSALVACSLALAVRPAAAVAAPESCPRVAIIAARGSDQNDPAIDTLPTRYASGSPWVSNGYEAANLRAFLSLVERRYEANHGVSVLRNVPVLALDAQSYPAEFPVPRIAAVGEELSVAETATRIAQLLARVPLPQLVGDAAVGLTDSLVRGATAVHPTVARFEAETGCAPRYIMLGYSQGAALLQVQEADLAARAELYGALYLGNPLTPLGIGSARHRLDYCLSGDFVCDLNVDSAADALSSGGGIHATYFLAAMRPLTAADERVADTFGDWVADAGR